MRIAIRFGFETEAHAKAIIFIQDGEAPHTKWLWIIINAGLFATIM